MSVFSGDAKVVGAVAGQVCACSDAHFVSSTVTLIFAFSVAPDWAAVVNGARSALVVRVEQ